jgi:hypothetical protein
LPFDRFLIKKRVNLPHRYINPLRARIVVSDLLFAMSEMRETPLSVFVRHEASKAHCVNSTCRDMRTASASTLAPVLHEVMLELIASAVEMRACQ